MEIFDSKEKFILDTSNEKSYSLGTFGVIYKKDNQCIKVFNEFNVSKEPFIILKSLNLSCCSLPNLLSVFIIMHPNGKIC